MTAPHARDAVAGEDRGGSAVGAEPGPVAADGATAGLPPAATLAGLLWPLRWWLVATALAAFVTLGSGVGLVAMSAYLISRAALVDSTATLALAITGVRFFAVLRAVFRYVERYVGHLTTFRALTAIRVWFFRGIEPLAPSRLTRHRAGDLLSRITDDIDALQDVALRVVVPAVAAALVTVLVAVVLGSFSPVLGLAAVLFLVLVGVVLPWSSRRAGRNAAEAVALADAALEAEAVESLSGLPELVAWGREDRVMDRLADTTRRRAALDRRLAHLRGLTSGLAALLVGLGAMTLLALAVPMVTDGELDGVYLAVMPLVVLAAFEAVTPLAGAMDALGRARGAAARLGDLTAGRPPVPEPEEPAPPPRAAPEGTTPDGTATGGAATDGPSGRGSTGIALEVEDLAFAHGPDGPPALRGLSLSAPAGSELVLTGPSGSGKSTLVSLLLRFEHYRHGSVRLGGVELSEMASADTRALVAAVRQHDHLFDTSVRDNLLVADPDADDGEVWAALDAADATEFVTALPGGLDARIGEDGSRLSGGQRQRLMIARALLADAPVLVLDEATAHLDAATEARVLDGVRRACADRTLVVITHHVPVALAGSPEARIVDGRVVRPDARNPPWRP